MIECDSCKKNLIVNTIRKKKLHFLKKRQKTRNWRYLDLNERLCSNVTHLFYTFTSRTKWTIYQIVDWSHTNVDYIFM